MIKEENAVVLMVDDDPDDRLIAKEAFEEIGLKAQLLFLGNGEELMDYVNRQGDFTDPASSPVPDVILLDINMPRMNGIEALQWLKAHATGKVIPVVMLTNSGNSDTIKQCYELGASSYVRKPLEFKELITALSSVRQYWFGTVTHPNRD